MFASTAWLSELTPVAHPLNDMLYQCFKAIALSEDGSKPSELFTASAAMDRELKIQYYATPEEISARAFEAFVADSVNNSFLVGNTRTSEEAKQGLYPVNEQRRRINRAFESYFQSLAKALNQHPNLERE
jgi:hypothetical protein